MTAIPLIVVVDDDEAVREATKELMEALGFAAEAFASAGELLQSDRLSEATCLIVDVQMPGINGLQLQTHLIDAGNRIPIILITAHPDKAARRRAMRAGAVGYFRKPFTAKTLLKALRSVLNDRDSDGKS